MKAALRTKAVCPRDLTDHGVKHSKPYRTPDFQHLTLRVAEAGACESLDNVQPRGYRNRAGAVDGRRLRRSVL